jgi:transposase-like protein
MSKAMARDPICRRRRFQPEIIELCVRWYLTYRLSYRDHVVVCSSAIRSALLFFDSSRRLAPKKSLLS